MNDSIETPPVDDSLTVLSSKSIYRTDEWWKVVVRYQYEDSAAETAVYLWHRDDSEWTRKNKYVIKTKDAWETDRRVIASLLNGAMSETENEFPVSDYYHVDAGTTISKSDDWWKAIVRIDQKGSYETEEVVVYLWQNEDGQWFRRQKYAVKNWDSWDDERTAISSMLTTETSGQPDDSDESVSDRESGEDTTDTAEPVDTDIKSDLEQIGDEIEDHLSETFET
ncbi:hypothetical protein [Halococcoides cellulosivorans]|uniref:Uncharacterized protein n=1 Tax=Halococcoides cellulosivorans TaxID=1679096 RepID=A0A2R4X3Z5_9EURY|nr:hypothetical protein [Halococcoides cellulosivorans]AWB28521.1 hypothetical protein HARCEL1_12930 [Halococcoides cellulosivorans]